VLLVCAVAGGSFCEDLPCAASYPTMAALSWGARILDYAGTWSCDHRNGDRRASPPHHADHESLLEEIGKPICPDGSRKGLADGAMLPLMAMSSATP